MWHQSQSVEQCAHGVLMLREQRAVGCQSSSQQNKGGTPLPSAPVCWCKDIPGTSLTRRLFLPEPVVQAMALDGLEAFEVEHALRELLAGWISVHAGLQVCFARLQKRLQQHSGSQPLLTAAGQACTETAHHAPLQTSHCSLLTAQRGQCLQMQLQGSNTGTSPRGPGMPVAQKEGTHWIVSVDV